MPRSDELRPGRRAARLAALLATCALAGACIPRQALRARNLLDDGDYAAADRAIADGLRKAPDDLAWRALKLRALVASGERGAAVAACRQRPDPGLHLSLAESLLWWGLRHPDPRVRLDALQQVRAVDAGSLEGEVVRRLDDPDEVVRSWAAVALSATPAGADALERQLRSPDARARAVAVRELGRIAKGAALSTIARFNADGAAAVRAACAAGLAYTGAAEALSPLRRLAADADRDVRAAALQALARLGHADARGTAARALEDPHLAIRLAAVRALRATFGDRAAQLLAPLANGRDPLVALAAGAELARLGPSQPALNAIARGLVDRRPEVRVAAVTTAISVGDAVALQLVRKVLGDTQPAVRLAAARALVATDRAAAIPIARSVHALACPAPKAAPGAAAQLIPLCIEAAELLARADRAEGFATLARLARQAADPAQRQAALRWAALRGSVADVGLDALADPDPATALFAAAQLYRELR